ncbi:MAG: YIP1 family protein [Acetobacteraceae bacterium]
MDPNQIITRAKGLILTPRAEFEAIAAEPVANPLDLLVKWAVPVSAVPAVASFLGALLFVLGFGWIGPLLVSAVVGYVLGLVGVFVVAKIVEILAPRFGGSADAGGAMKLAVYAPTAGWLAGIFLLIPPLGFLAILGLYSLYLFWIAIPILTRVPEEKRLVFVLAVIGCAVVVNIVISLVARAFI